MKILDFSEPEKTSQEVMRDYNAKYRVKHAGTIQCKCGAVIKEISKYTHYATAKHKRWLSAIPMPN